jgi:signal transduction histidine kinase
MAITKQLIRSHGGTIEAQSETGKGSTFVIEIPEQMQERPSSGDTLGSGL